MTLKRPPLYAVHEEAGAEFTDFGGWEMPVEFDSIRTEHEAVRNEAGVFDVSHMGEIEVTGPGAGELTDRLVTNDVAGLDVGGACYTAVTDEDGVMLDDTIVYRQDEDRYLFVPNAGHDEQAHERWIEHRDRWELEAEVENRTDDYAMVALQGPDAVETAVDVGDGIAGDLSRFSGGYLEFCGVECWVARTGFTGEDGIEAIVPVEDAEAVWRTLVDEEGCQPCGLGARDTLRLEAGLLLSGQDFHPDDQPRTPLEAGIGFAVDLDSEFVGRDALAEQKRRGIDETIVGLRLLERGIARNGHEILDPNDEPIGVVTSGTMSPTLGEAIALGYVPVGYADTETRLRIGIRGESKKAKVANKRFLEGDE